MAKASMLAMSMYLELYDTYTSSANPNREKQKDEEALRDYAIKLKTLEGVCRVSVTHPVGVRHYLWCKSSGSPAGGDQEAYVVHDADSPERAQYGWDYDWLSSPGTEAVFEKAMGKTASVHTHMSLHSAIPAER